MGEFKKKRKRVRSITWPLKLAKTSCNDSITFQLQPRTDNLSTTNSGTRRCHVCVCRRRTSSLQWLQSVSPLLTSFSSPLSPHPVLLRNLGCHFGRDRYHERPCFSDFVVYKKRNIFFFGGRIDPAAHRHGSPRDTRYVCRVNLIYVVC